MNTNTKKKKMVCQHNSYAHLTIGNEYEILGEEENKIFVINDNGKKTSYYKSRFKEVGTLITQ